MPFWNIGIWNASLKSRIPKVCLTTAVRCIRTPSQPKNPLGILLIKQAQKGCMNKASKVIKHVFVSPLPNPYPGSYLGSVLWVTCFHLLIVKALFLLLSHLAVWNYFFSLGCVWSLGVFLLFHFLELVLLQPRWRRISYNI